MTHNQFTDETTEPTNMKIQWGGYFLECRAALRKDFLKFLP